MSDGQVVIKDGTSADKNIAVKQVTVGSETVEIQEVVQVDPATRAPIAFPTHATQLQILSALQQLNLASFANSELDATTTAGYIYEYSTNAVNANAADAVWRVSRYRVATQSAPAELLWADGDQNYDNAIDDLANLTYS